MRKLALIGITAFAASFAVAPAANAASVCREVCDGGTCVQKCKEQSSTTVIRKDRDVTVRERERPRAPGIELNVPGVSVDIGR